MYLYLVQHGKAFSKEEDPQRGLSAEGIEETERVGARLAGRSRSPTEIWHSTKLRSEQTARILADQLKIKGRLTEHPSLAPSDPIAQVTEDIEKNEADIMIAGHLPFLPKLLSFLLNGKEDQCPVAFRNSAVIGLKKEGNKWAIEWILHPDFA